MANGASLNWQASLFFMRETGELAANVPQALIDVLQGNNRGKMVLSLG